ncbi:sigma-70 family RNA polymerase sigma factor [Staphylococcus simiae]|uniref:sigma-70 family RNA polymerase sigma factor n=1 Tax=Staphylococcus simiae TaxID=308354 RepID=UPI001A97C344|nr:sigma-70 family RNA polymerase sigma factor [Staphylococcus simiae]MBO1199446.1 sigma-70 family RNA polymerase sigma factor [Staphylococcus simiae]MBO1201750.1 sigma-70 family RNA polymerase sigma factor [Staphylococcus simiae]MBO1203957.1 sigma-70 family RNA polymerase sigma factor [Staphylococcus simiae]MBO1211435.1 sigma-70 family RNA polymerase sigma factor [Staphylococcus simiae]MBO1230189.1 sigma-70 family RNA polymerase sigma factor [Staphylococcus simiae]
MTYQFSNNSNDKQHLDTSTYFNDLLKQLHPTIMSRIMKMRINDCDKEDLYQEVIIRIYKATKTFDFNGKQPFNHYVQCVISSVKYDYLRKYLAITRRTESLINEYRVKYSNHSLYKETELSCLYKIQLTELQRQFRHLSIFEKEVMTLVCQYYSPKEIATILNVSDKKVYNAIQRSKQKIKTYC